ncbi:PREDICTED: homeobox-leucine zipper protein ATHB-X-like [Camelina sativa]|uniref:Homeobox-leucine zipper protein ATHB-X-like n=1 Tax=Camelina sativa TaxID=90675 RepID=A0ABM0WHC4_CAMSA|nr:PREDICTED: homeobox-leucine zipper protein ATHB-X-like [Camelina sativa]
MAISPNSSSLELTISIPSFSPSPSSPGGDHHGMRDFDINQTPKTEADHTIGATQHANEEDSNSGGRRRKKLRLTKEQSHHLEESFIQNHTLTPKQKKDLATFLKLSQRQVEVWFQNRRARSKLKHTEMECEYLKRWFGSLKEQNRRLQIEVEELRALKPSSTTALTMCPRCERVSDAADNDSNAVQEGAAVSSSRSRITISSSSSLC